MSAPIELSALDLSALLCSKVCHDVINPVAAMENGFQLLEMDQKPESREEAMKLIRHSAVQATAKLKYARIAYGSSGSPKAQLDVGDAGELGQQLFEPEIKVTFNIPEDAGAEEQGKAAAQPDADRVRHHPARRLDEYRSDRQRGDPGL